MKSVLWMLLGLVIGGIGGLFVRALGEPEVSASTNFTFMDTLADQQSPYLNPKGSWRGGNFANRINIISILCDVSEDNVRYAPSRCDASPRRQAMALYVQYVVPYHEA